MAVASPFSGALQLTDLDDFIGPSQDGGSQRLERAKITLNDCLACSGCITSAESVLITQQSHEELCKVLNANKASNSSKKLVVVSVSPQSRASLAARFGMTPLSAAKKLTAFFKNLGVHFVFDTTFARNFSLLESQWEFVQRFQRRAEDKKALPMLAAACPGEVLKLLDQEGVSLLEVDPMPLDNINKDFQEVTLEKDGQTLLHFALAYGFRNIQNFVQKLKRGKLPYHYIEVMACPSGCLNGGGQIRAEGESSKDLLHHVERLYEMVQPEDPEMNKTIRDLYEQWLGGPTSEQAQTHLHTQYHAVEKASTGFNIKW
ncbi:hypothetical protein Chor_015104 [Crotalus horridus]